MAEPRSESETLQERIESERNRRIIERLDQVQIDLIAYYPKINRHRWIGPFLCAIGMVGILYSSKLDNQPANQCVTLHFESNTGFGYVVSQFQARFPRERITINKLTDQNNIYFTYSPFDWILNGDHNLTYCPNQNQ